MQQAETLTFLGHVLTSWKAPKPSYRLDTKGLAAEHLKLAAQYQMAVQNSRRLVIKNTKGEIY